MRKDNFLRISSKMKEPASPREACISRSRAPVLFSCAPLSLSPLAGRARKVVGGLGALIGAKSARNLAKRRVGTVSSVALRGRHHLGEAGVRTVRCG